MADIGDCYYGHEKELAALRASLSHERARAERLVDAATYALSRLKKLNENGEHSYAIEKLEEALSAYNQERGEKEGKA